MTMSVCHMSSGILESGGREGRRGREKEGRRRREGEGGRGGEEGGGGRGEEGGREGGKEREGEGGKERKREGRRRGEVGRGGGKEREGEGGKEREGEGGEKKGGGREEGEGEGGKEGEGRRREEEGREREHIICSTRDMHDCTLQNLEGLHHKHPPCNSVVSIHAKQVSERLIGLQGEQNEPSISTGNRHVYTYVFTTMHQASCNGGKACVGMGNACFKYVHSCSSMLTVCRFWLFCLHQKHALHMQYMCTCTCYVCIHVHIH